MNGNDAHLGEVRNTLNFRKNIDGSIGKVNRQYDVCVSVHHHKGGRAFVLHKSIRVASFQVILITIEIGHLFIEVDEGFV